MNELVEACRDTCLWYFRPDYLPATDAERLRVLEAIRRHGNRATFQRAARLEAWLSRP